MSVERLKPRPRTLTGKIAAEVRRHPYAYIVTALFSVGGAFGATLIFPEAPPAAAAFGGFALGLYAALCAVPNKFMG